MNPIKLVKRGYSGIPLLTVPIQTKRQRLLNDADFNDLLEMMNWSAIWVPTMRFEVILKYCRVTRKQARQIKSKTGRELLRSAYTSGQMGESFETWKKSMTK